MRFVVEGKSDDDLVLLRIGDRRFPAQRGGWESVGRGIYKRDEPLTTRQVYVRTESGYTLSIIWGSSTYSSNYHHPFGWSWTSHGSDETGWPEFIEEPTTVEVGLFHGRPDDTGLAWVDPDGEPLHYVAAAALIDLIDMVSRWPSHPEDEQRLAIEAELMSWQDRRGASADV